MSQKPAFNWSLSGVAQQIAIGWNIATKTSYGFLKAATDYFYLYKPDGITLARLNIGDAVNPSEAVSYQQLQSYFSTHANNVISSIFTGSAPPAVVANQLILCTVSGGSYVAGKLYVGISAIWTLYTPADGTLFTFASQSTIPSGIITSSGNAVTTVYQDHSYNWDSTTSTYLDLGAVYALPTHIVKYFKSTIGFGASSSTVSRACISGGTLISVRVNILTAFDVTPVSLSVNINGGTALFDQTAIDFTTVGVTIIEVLADIASSGNINVVSNTTGSTAGSMSVAVMYED